MEEALDGSRRKYNQIPRRTLKPVFAPLRPDHSLSSPVGALMRPTHFVAPEDSIRRAAAEMRLNGSELIPVAREGVLVGVFNERILAQVLGDDRDLAEPVSEVMDEIETIRPYDSGAEALRRLAEPGVNTLIVVDDRKVVRGLISATDLVPRRRMPPRPAVVGGMATPFGVYLTNGAVKGGASGFALMCTGAVMFVLLVGALNLTKFAMPAILSFGIPASAQDGILSVLTPMLFLLFMRLIPLSGTHAAEHQVVHALERGEDLVPEIVRRMPRVHPRCGTNFAAGASIFVATFGFQGIPGLPWVQNDEYRLIIACAVTLFFWRKVGSVLQEFVTTRPANDKQLQNGIRAAEELLDSFARASVTTPSIPQRIWNSGFLHVMAGSSIMAGIVSFLSWKFNLGLEQ